MTQETIYIDTVTGTQFCQRLVLYTRGVQKESAIPRENLPYVYIDLPTHTYFRS